MDEIKVIDKNELSKISTFDEEEKKWIVEAAELMQDKYFDHALLDIWNCTIHNLKRRIESYSVDIFCSVAPSNNFKSQYNENGLTIAERWKKIDDYTIVDCAFKIGIINEKTQKILHNIGWMRNHVSASHDNDNPIYKEDLTSWLLLLKANLFESNFPNPANSAITLIDNFKKNFLNDDQFSLVENSIKSFNEKDIQVMFGYALQAICDGADPQFSNVSKIFSVIWCKAPVSLKQTAGNKLYSLLMSPNEKVDKIAFKRLYNAVINVGGIKFLPSNLVQLVYKNYARRLKNAKDTAYGWSQEVIVAYDLLKVGIEVPDSVFVELYQEILAVWCGNYWGRSGAHSVLRSFVFDVSDSKKEKIIKLFSDNFRVKYELDSSKPNSYAINLLEELKKAAVSVKIKDLVDVTIKKVLSYKS